MNGKELFVSITENYEEAKGMKAGDVVTIKFIGTNAHGTLLYPKFYRQRTDVTWNDLIKT